MVKMNDIDAKVKIQSLLNVIKASESFLKNIKKENDDLEIFLKRLHSTLTPYNNLDAEILLIELKSSLKQYKKINKIEHKKLLSVLNEEEIKGWDMEKIKTFIKNNKLKKDDLLMIAKHSLNMPIGSLQNLKKEFIINKIFNIIDNIQKLDTIKKIAKE